MGPVEDLGANVVEGVRGVLARASEHLPTRWIAANRICGWRERLSGASVTPPSEKSLLVYALSVASSATTAASSSIADRSRSHPYPRSGTERPTSGYRVGEGFRNSALDRDRQQPITYLTGLTGKSSFAYPWYVSDVFEAIGAPVRRAILDEMIDRNGQTLFELCSRLAMKHGMGLTRQAISHHLGVLEAAGLITTERKGRNKFHYLDTSPLVTIVERWLTPRRRKERKQ